MRCTKHRSFCYCEAVPEESITPALETLLTGHFFETSSYQNWRTRGTHDELLIYTVSGCGRFGYPGGVHLTQPGELTLLRAGTPHDYSTDKTLGRWELLWTHFHPRAHWLDWLHFPEIAPGFISISSDSERQQRIEMALLEMHRLATSGETHREQYAMNALERVWLECLPPEFHNKLNERIARAVTYLRAHFNEPLDLPNLAAHCHLSLSRLGHLFTAQVGQSPQQFLESFRLTRASQLLMLTSRTVSSIALEVGYADPLYFSRRFRILKGYSPRQYRERPDENGKIS